MLVKGRGAEGLCATSGACSARLLVPLPPGWNEDVHSLGPGGQGDNPVRMKQQARRRLNA